MPSSWREWPKPEASGKEFRPLLYQFRIGDRKI